jgi:hypothetical protein
MRRAHLRTIATSAVIAALTAGCGGHSVLRGARGSSSTRTVTVTTTLPGTPSGGRSPGPAALGFPAGATKNTTRVPGATAAENAAAVALAVFPSAAAGTHPPAVALAPTDDWQAAVAASSLMASPFRAPVLLSGPGSLPAATAQALKQLAPTGAAPLGGAQVVAVGDVPRPSGLHVSTVSGGDAPSLAAAIDAYEAHARGHESLNVVIAPADAPAYAMPAAGYAAESGEPVLFAYTDSLPAATVKALKAHHHPRIYVLGPASVISDAVMGQLARYGTVKRVGGPDPAANSVAFAEYRDPACRYGQACAHIPHSFGWAIRSPGHAFVLLPDSDPLEAAAASALSSSGGYGPQLLLTDPNTLPKAVLNYFLDYATPGYTQEGPTAAVYNHGWLIGDTRAISVATQAQIDSLLEVVPQK